MQKRVLANISIIIFFFSLVAFAAFAQSNSTNFDIKPSFEWLIQNCEDGWCGSVESTALYAMSMKLAGYSSTYGAQAIKRIQLEKKDPESCFPKNSCNIRDTSFAYWALSNYAEDTSGIEDYIKRNLGVGLTENWWLEIITTAENQKCKIGYPSGGNQEEKEILVDKGKFPECNAGQPETFFDLNNCITPNLVNSNPNLELTIDCSSIGQGTVISIVYNTDSSYYLTEQATAAKYKTQIQNACHKKGGACDKDTSLWANWVLKNKNSDINTNLYLLTSYDNLDPVDLSLLYLTSSDAETKSSYLNALLSLQKLDGSFNKNNYETAVSLLALSVGGSTEEILNAIDYLKKSRKSDGSWDSDKTTTALVLYAAFADASVTLPSMPGPSGIESDSLCGDGVCDPDESVYLCFKDCQQQESEICVANGICESDYGETSANCPVDCSCGDGICDDSEVNICSLDCGSTSASIAICGNSIREGSEECDGSDDAACSAGFACTSSCVCFPEESGDEGGFGWMIISALVLLLIVIGIYIAYKYYSPSKKNSSKRSIQGPMFSFPSGNNTPFGNEQETKMPQNRLGAPTRGASRKSDAELELEKSLREAKKLLGGK